jgi:O-antigen ligase
LDNDKLWAFAMVGLFAVQLGIGALIFQVPTLEYLPLGLGCIVLFIALWRLRSGLPSKSALFACAILLCALGISAIQLIPLPPAIWTTLPGRQFALDALSLTDQKPGWLTLSLTPMETINYLIYSIPAIALFFAALSLDPKSRKTVFLACVAIAIFSALLGLAQKAGESRGFLQLFESAGGMGFFANHNFHGALLFTSIPLMAALALSQHANKSLHPLVIVCFSIAFLMIILVGIGATASRAAVILTMASVTLSLGLLWCRKIQDQQTVKFGFKFFVFVAILFAAAQFSLAGISRLVETDKLADGRAIMAAKSYAALKDYFPFGSGFGSFVPVYAMGEKPDEMLGGYVNHAHNDWIELVLEGGLPMAAIITAFLLWYGMGTFSAWRERANGTGGYSVRAASIVIFLLLCHSFSDYPLRTRALMALFAMSCGFLTFGFESQSAKRTVRKPTPILRPDSPQRANSETTKGYSRPKGPYFVRKEVPPEDSGT